MNSMSKTPLSERIAWLMDKEEQLERPKHERYRWQLKGGLHLHMLHAGHVYILAGWRWDVEPSDTEIKVLVDIIKSYERPSATLIATTPTLEFPIKGKVRVAKYVVFSFSALTVEQEPVKFEQAALFKDQLPPEETAVGNNYEVNQ